MLVPGRLVVMVIACLWTLGVWRGGHARAQHGVRGITVGPVESAQQPGRGYGTDASWVLLKHLKSMGTNWISVTPFGRVWSLRSTHISDDFEAPAAQNRSAVGRMVDQAHALGLRVLLIPHLWVETGGWRGEIEPEGPGGWAQYVKSYENFVLRWAEVAADHGVDALSVGVECTSWSGSLYQDWRRLIGRVRARFGGVLTYSANWDEAEHVIFWDLLDMIGINAFFPLADRDDAPDGVYRRWAARHARAFSRLSRTVGKPLWFTEVGYTTRRNAAVRPWLWPDHMTGVVVDELEQARAMAAVVGAFVREPWFRGFFVWRYYANLDDVSQEARWGFSPHGKLAGRALRTMFQSRWQLRPWVPTRRRSQP